MIIKFEISFYLYLLWYEKFVDVLPAERFHVTATVRFKFTVDVSWFVNSWIPFLRLFFLLVARLADAPINKCTIFQSTFVGHTFNLNF